MAGDYRCGILSKTIFHHGGVVDLGIVLVVFLGECGCALAGDAFTW